ncbi:uncharacterized protein LOC100187452 [Ciona intestinalis]
MNSNSSKVLIMAMFGILIAILLSRCEVTNAESISTNEDSDLSFINTLVDRSQSGVTQQEHSRVKRGVNYRVVRFCFRHFCRIKSCKKLRKIERGMCVFCFQRVCPSSNLLG